MYTVAVSQWLCLCADGWYNPPSPSYPPPTPIRPPPYILNPWNTARWLNYIRNYKALAIRLLYLATYAVNLASMQ